MMLKNANLLLPHLRPTLRHALVLAASAVVVLTIGPQGASSAAAGPCDPPVNEIVCENSKPGTPQSIWGVGGNGDPAIQGFATAASIEAGESIDFKIKTDAADYAIRIYRIGYYGGDGAREIDVVSPSAALPQQQPECLTDSTSGLIDCGNWSVSASWTASADAVSGVYVARLIRSDTGGDSHILFVVRDDDGGSELLFQTADTTWNAYNNYGGVSLYGHGSSASWWSGRGFKVSYDRPLTMREQEPYSSFFSAEYPMVRWLERNGYDVSYFTGVDTARRGAELLEHKAFLSVGHDEYWSGAQRANVEAARDAGINLAFFSGNEVFWKTRWEPSIDGTSTPWRTLVSYKETTSNAKIDPTPTWTGTWRDARFSPPSDGGRPENALTGTLFAVNATRNDPMQVSAEDGRLRFWRNTGIDTLAPGTVATLPEGVLGYEWDEDKDNGHRPAGLMRLSSTTLSAPRYLLDNGSTYGPGTATHSLILYRARSGALVFGAGTVQWSWGLDVKHDQPGTPVDARMQQATVNLFADMGVQPATLQATLVPASASNDTTPPEVTITSPADGTAVPRGQLATISGTASDTAGVVGAVEVSIDHGATWHPATGRENWSYSWVTSGFGAVTVRVRAADDSGNIGPNASIGLQVGGCPCSIWSDAVTPATAAFDDPKPYELGVKFRSDIDGYVTGIRFFKGVGNAGTHLGHLWSPSGTTLGEVTFTSESASGWQQAIFAAPIPIQANTTYIASYYAPNGRYALDRPFFGSATLNPPLRALADGADGGNGVFRSGTSGFPNQSKLSSNYWVDLIFEQNAVDRRAPSVLGTSPTAGAASVGIFENVTARFDEAIDHASLSTQTFELRAPGGATVAAGVSYDPASKLATLDPAGQLTPGTTYTAMLRGGPTGVRDVAGNALTEDVTWSFTTFTCPCSLWADSVTPATAAFNDTLNYELGVKFRSDLDGYVTGIRFYKGAGNSGTHLGHLWSASGTMLGEVTFTGESATGWQQATFAAPIPIQANTTYIASYYAPNGRYALDRPYFATAGRDRGPLHALRDGVDGPNAVFQSRSSGFPTQTKLSSNYWVDLVYQQTAVDERGPSGAETTPPPLSPPPPSPPSPPPPPPPAPQPPAPARCLVSNLKGKTVVQARRVLTSRRCALGKVTRRYSAKVKRRRIVWQSRRPGIRLPRGTKVAVAVSRGRRPSQ